MFRDRWAGVGGHDRTNFGIKIREQDDKMAIAGAFIHERTCMCDGTTASTPKSRPQTQWTMCVALSDDVKRRSPSLDVRAYLADNDSVAVEIGRGKHSTALSDANIHADRRVSINATPRWRAKCKDLKHKY